MSFEVNSSQQISFNDSVFSLTAREKKALDNSWAKIFADEIFPNIDEERFSVLYSSKASRPNAPVNVIIGALIIKELFDYSDDEIVENLMLDLHLQYALHTTSFEEQPISDKTLSRFRSRCYNYETTHGIDLYHDCVKDLSSKIAKLMNLSGRIKRMDSMMIESNIRFLSRMELIYTCISKLAIYFDKNYPNKIPDDLKHYTDSNDYNRIFYHQLNDNSLFDKLQVFDGDISPMLEPDNNAIAIAVSLDDYGNLPNPEYYPKVGDTITATYADDVKYIDSHTGELRTEDTPEEYFQAKLYGARDVEYTVCALVELPNSMSYRYGGIGYDVVLSVDTAQRDSGGAAIPMLYLFDTADEVDEAEAEQYLSKLTAGEFSPLMYESKATARSEFAQFRQMFLLIGGILCAIIGLVGLLNFFNALMTGILSRRREFAVLQAVGMTNRQLKTMLIYEGLFYAMSSVSAAFILSLAVGPLAGKMLGSMFWFFEYRFTILPVLLTIPVFLLLGWLIPCMMYDNAAKCSVVEQLRDAQ